MLNPALTTIASVLLPDHPSWSETWPYVLTGIGVVIGTLVILGIIIQLLGTFFKAQAARTEKTKADTPMAPLVVTAPAGEEVGPHAGHEPELVAVIAAAVSTVIKEPCRILSIESKTGIKMHAWAAEGRRQIHTTRKTR